VPELWTLGVIERHMENQESKRPAGRKVGVSFFIAAIVVASVAVWLCILGDLPAIKTGDHTYIMFGGMSINGTQMPGWTFYFIPAGLFFIAIILLIIGWRKSRVSGHEDA
jgi:hypothetical protein